MTYDEYIKSTNDYKDWTLVFHVPYKRSADDLTKLQGKIDYVEKWSEYFGVKKGDVE